MDVATLVTMLVCVTLGLGLMSLGIYELRRRKALLKKMVLFPEDPMFAVATIEHHAGPTASWLFGYPMTTHYFGTGTRWIHYPSLRPCSEALCYELCDQWEKLQILDVVPPAGADIKTSSPEQDHYIH